MRGHKEAWVREFMALWDANANEAMIPPESRGTFLNNFNTSAPRVSEYRNYLAVYDAAVKAGLSGWHLARTSIKILSNEIKLVDDAHALVAALAGEHAAAQRQKTLRTADHLKRSGLKPAAPKPEPKPVIPGAPRGRGRPRKVPL